MKEQRSTEIKVGLTVVIGILVFLYILGWAKNFSLTSPDRRIEIKFNNIAGLEIGDYVTVNGYREGNVEDIIPKGNSVIVKILLDNSVQLKKDATFSISMLDLMGGKKLEINPGNDSQTLDYSKVQNGTFSADIPAVMTMVGSLQDDIYTVMKQVKVTLSSINNYLTDKSLNAEVKSSISNMNELLSKLNGMVDENRKSVKTIASNSADLTEEAKNFIKENKSTITGTVNDLSVTLKKTDSLITKLNRITDETTKQQNNLGKVLYDQNLYKNLNETMKQANELTKLLLKQLKDEGLKVDAHIKLF